MSNRSRRGGLLFVSIMIWLAVCTGTGVGDDREVPEIAPQIQRLIALLPRDTETLHVAQSFAMPARENDQPKNLPPFDFRMGCQLAAMEGLWELDHGKYLKLLAGRKVAVALRGSRNVDVVSYFGSLRSEGCAVIVLETDLDAGGKAWTEMLRTGARQIKKIGGHDVFVFDSTTVMEASVTPKPWQGTFLVLLSSKVILSATSDKYLEEVLANLDVVPTVRALPDALPEWKHVDTTAPGWMLRHVPETTAERSLDGVTMTSHRDHCRISFLARAKEKQDPETFIRDRWFKKVSTEELFKQVEIEQGKDGAISVTCGLNAFEIDGAMLAWRVFALPGEK